jgi:hypothetical protein
MILCFRAMLMLLAYDILSMACRFPMLYSLVKRWRVVGTPDPKTIDLVSRAINYACVWYPKRVLCLQRSFVTTYLLRHQGVAAEMVLGAQKLPFKAHAWVEVEGRPVNERSDVQANYAVWDKC